MCGATELIKLFVEAGLQIYSVRTELIMTETESLYATITVFNSLGWIEQ